jgi:cold shock CspA family protein
MHRLGPGLGDGGEKGIDVWFALEAFELAIYKKFNVVVLVAGDGDYVPLVRKLNTLGTRTMLTAWDFKTSGFDGQERETRASQFLINEVTYAVMMDSIIDDRSRSGDRVVNNLFVAPPQPSVARAARPTVASGELQEGVIQNLKDGFGFITPDSGGDNLFFHWRAVKDGDFDELEIGDLVLFVLGSNDRGPCAVDVRRPDNSIAGDV